MGILRLGPDSLFTFRLDAGAAASAISAIPAAPGAAAASSPAPVVLRNCLRSLFIRFTSVCGLVRQNPAIRAALYADAPKRQPMNSRQKSFSVYRKMPAISDKQVG